MGSKVVTVFMDLSCLEDLPLVEKSVGDEIFVQGERSDSLYILERGCVAIFKNDVFITEVRECGACFGEMSYLLESEDTATVRVKELSTFRWIEDLPAYLEVHPQLLRYLAKGLAERLNAVNQYLAEIKRQYGSGSNHFDLLDEIVKSLMVKTPEVSLEREVPDDSDPPVPGTR